MIDLANVQLPSPTSVDKVMRHEVCMMENTGALVNKLNVVFKGSL